MNIAVFRPLTAVVLAGMVLASCGDDYFGEGTGEVGTSSIAVDESLTVASVAAQHAATHDKAADYVWDAATEATITLNGTSIATSSAAVTIAGTQAVITAGGNYRVSGTLTDGQIVVASADEATVRVILDGANITNSTGAAIAVADAAKTVVILADGSVNSLADGANYVLPTGTTEPNATLFSKDNLTIAGSGSLTIDANYADAIVSKDGLVLAGGADINITAVDDGIRGKDYVYVKHADIVATTGGDGIKADRDSVADLGFVHIVDGSFSITAGADGIQAATDILVAKGDFNVKTGGGSSAAVGASATAKGLKAGNILVIDDGNLVVSSADDALHSNFNLTINGGTLSLSTADDGLHADTSVVVNGGNITVTKAVEGIEGFVIVVNGGEVRLTTSDDGINAGGGASASVDSHSGNPDYYFKITGGRLVVFSGGDGLDSNGSAFMKGGTAIVHGPTADNNAPIDFNLGFETTGGTVVAAGSSRMAQAPGGATTATQNAVLITFSSAQSANQLVRIETDEGNLVVAMQPSKSYQSLAVTSPLLETGQSFKVIVGGTAASAATDGLFDAGTTFSGGSTYKSFSVSGLVTSVQ